MNSRKKALTVKQAQEIDKQASSRRGIPSIILMENAGRGAAEEIRKSLKNKKAGVLVVCGSGNNGGDGCVVARHLTLAGIAVQVVLVGKAQKLKGDALTNFGILKKFRLPVKEHVKVTSGFIKKVQSASCVVDAIFGIGLNREIAAPFDAFIETINAHAKRVISLDIPSGLDGTSGRIYGVCVKAKRTITFYAPKIGLLKGEGPKQAGRVIVKHIGF